MPCAPEAGSSHSLLLSFARPQGRQRRDEGQGVMFAFWTVSLLIRAVQGPVGHDMACRIWSNGGRERWVKKSFPSYHHSRFALVHVGLSTLFKKMFLLVKNWIAFPFSVSLLGKRSW